MNKHDYIVPVPPDGRWGWVIVTVSFFCCGVVDGMVSVFGVLFQPLLIYYDATESQLAWAGSFLAGFFLLSGPLVSISINTLGCRITTMLGGFVSSIAFFSSIFAQNLLLFIFTFGFCGGIGLGLVYLPASVMVGYYFEKKRGLAAGISSAGAGAGILLLCPLAAFLNEVYDHRGCLLIMSGICLNCVVCGSLMRPLRIIPKRSFHQSRLRQSTLPSLPEVVDETVEEVETHDEHEDIIFIKANHHCADVHVDVNSKTSSIMGSNNLQSSNHHLHATDVLAKHLHQHLPHNRTSFHSVAESSLKPSAVSRLSLISLKLADVDNPLRKKDIFYSHSFTSLHQNESYHERVSTQHINKEQKKASKNSFEIGERKLKMRIFMHPVFIFICLSNICIQLGFFIPILFLPIFAESCGIDVSWGAYLLSILGFSNMIGRAASGAFASLPRFNILHYNCLCLIASAILTLCLIFNQYFAYFVIYSLLYGYLIAAFIPLTTIFLVKYMGLDHLTTSFGLLGLVKGIATLSGAPIAGALFVSTKSYSLTFLFPAVMFTLAAILFYQLPILFDRQNARKEYKLFYSN